ncbi:MAG: hypothetical protein ACPGRX_03045, partial [Bdellovibrionales bacterium]
ITSPPYMPVHHSWNPLYGGDPAHAGYDRYLSRMAEIFKNLSAIMKRGALVVVQADNLQRENRRYRRWCAISGWPSRTVSVKRPK